MLIEYIQGIYSSDITESLHHEIYKKYNIDIVINCTQLHGFVDLSIKKVRIPVSNDLNYHTDIQILQKNLPTLLEFIYNNFVYHNILIVCETGQTVSPIIIALFMVKYGKIKLSDIKKILKSKNNDISIELDLSIFRI